MSSQELDKLFKDKLEELKKEPSVKAWSEVQTQISKKGNRGVWFYMKVAAAILLLITFTGFLVSRLLKDQPSRLVTDDEQKKEKIEMVNPPVAQLEGQNKKEDQQPTATNSTDGTDQQPVIAQTLEDTKKEKHTGTRQKVITPKEVKNQVAFNEQEDEQSVDLIEEVADLTVNEVVATYPDREDKVLESNVNDENQTTDQVTGKTLVFDIEEFDMKTAVTAIYETAEDSKKNGFKKIVDLIKSVKEGDGALAELREAKNNLLVLNSKSKENDDSK